eukprot:c27373_g1_i2 orf=250-618(-)
MVQTTHFLHFIVKVNTMLLYKHLEERTNTEINQVKKEKNSNLMNTNYCKSFCISENSLNIIHSLCCIAQGRPGDSDPLPPDAANSSQVLIKRFPKIRILNTAGTFSITRALYIARLVIKNQF